MGKLKPKQRFFIQLMAVTGRRSVDLLRLKWNLVKIKENEVCAVIAKDKTHKGLVSFNFKFDDYDLPIGKQQFIDVLKNGVENESGLVFKNFMKQQVTQKSKTFRLHSLRNRKAISMLVSGATEQEVMSKIGWASLNSLLRYTKVSTSFIKQFSSYSEVVKFLFKLR